MLLASKFLFSKNLFLNDNIVSNRYSRIVCNMLFAVCVQNGCVRQLKVSIASWRSGGKDTWSLLLAVLTYTRYCNDGP